MNFLTKTITTIALASVAFVSSALERQVETYKEDANGVISFGTELVIDATPSEIWSALSDIDSYKEWNVFTPRVETTFEVGSPIVLHVRLLRGLPDSLLRQPETVAVFDVNQRMCWNAFVVSENFMRSFRCLEIDTNENGETVLRNTMEYAGYGRGLIYIFSANSVYNGFEDLSIGLKGYLESE